jgi:hypothetical protein
MTGEAIYNESQKEGRQPNERVVDDIRSWRPDFQTREKRGEKATEQQDGQNSADQGDYGM